MTLKDLANPASYSGPLPPDFAKVSSVELLNYSDLRVSPSTVRKADVFTAVEAKRDFQTNEFDLILKKTTIKK